MRGPAVVGEQGVQERAQHAPLWGPSVEDQRGVIALTLVSIGLRNYLKLNTGHRDIKMLSMSSSDWRNR